MPHAADVSVILPAYRAAETIAQALQSIADQTTPPGEVVVVDDGSDDGTVGVVREAAGVLPDGVTLKLIEQSNAGAGAARNRAVAEATKPWIAFLDADDLWLPEKLERSMSAIAEQDLDLVAHNGLMVVEAIKSLNDCAQRFRQYSDPFVGLYRKGYLDTCTVVMRRDDAITAGGFDETLRNAQDFELWLRVLRNPAKRFSVLDVVLSEAFETPGSIMSFIERRLSCCRLVATRYADALIDRPGGRFMSLWFRLIAIHAEAAQAYRRRGDWGRMTWVAARLPWSLFVDTIQVVAGNGPRRQAFLSLESIASGTPD